MDCFDWSKYTDHQFSENKTDQDILPSFDSNCKPAQQNIHGSPRSAVCHTFFLLMMVHSQFLCRIAEVYPTSTLKKIQIIYSGE